VDRLDYTKGLNEKLLALERLLECHAEFRERLVMAQIAEPSGDELPAYRYCRSRLVEPIDRINIRFGTERVPARHPARSAPRTGSGLSILPGRRYLLRRKCLHDGMNLVAKEFVSARDDERGVLVLSKFTGDARRLTGALIVNPYDIDDSARTLAVALHMTEHEQSNRIRAMRSVVGEFNAYRWAAEIMADAARLRTAPTGVHESRQDPWQSDVVHV
jgi:trehalose 6-phosphate synthase